MGNCRPPFHLLFCSFWSFAWRRRVAEHGSSPRCSLNRARRPQSKRAALPLERISGSVASPLTERVCAKLFPVPVHVLEFVDQETEVIVVLDTDLTESQHQLNGLFEPEHRELHGPAPCTIRIDHSL